MKSIFDALQLQGSDSRSAAMGQKDDEDSGLEVWL